MSFLDELEKNTNEATTLNGAKTSRSSLSPCLDFFALGAAKRNQIDDAVMLFHKAYLDDKQTALRTLFYIRDVRGGCGERSIFRACMNKLAIIDPTMFERMVEFVPTYGRWDDLLALPLTSGVIELIARQLIADRKTDKPSLLAKWLPSENTSSKDTQRKAKALYRALEMTPREYRKMLSELRKKIGLLEQNMSRKKWADIKYNQLPSQAFRKHTKAFRKHDATRFEKFLERVQSGEDKVNTETLYTYEVYDVLRNGDEDAANTLWDNLPEYTVQDALVMADVSGSMSGRPMSISVSLAMYFAEMNQGVFKNKFMTFSRHPQLVDIKGDTLKEKLRYIENAEWDMNTDIEKALDAILNAAIDSGAKDEEVPKILYIISDMEFDECVSGKTAFEDMKDKWEAAGITMPTVVFWNCNSWQNQVPVTKNEQGVTLVSGASQSVFKIAVEGKTPEEVMDEVVNSERYAQITV